MTDKTGSPAAKPQGKPTLTDEDISLTRSRLRGGAVQNVGPQGSQVKKIAGQGHSAPTDPDGH